MIIMYYLDHVSYGFIRINARSGTRSEAVLELEAKRYSNSKRSGSQWDYGVPLSAFTDKSIEDVI